MSSYYPATKTEQCVGCGTGHVMCASCEALLCERCWDNHDCPNEPAEPTETVPVVSAEGSHSAEAVLVIERRERTVNEQSHTPNPAAPASSEKP